MPTIGPMFCRLCGKPATNSQGYNGKHGICHTCFSLSIRKRIEVSCSYCGKQYELRPKEFETRGRFCSSECYHASAKGIKRPTTTTIKKTCPECKESFEVSQSQKARTYCTKRCAYNARSKPKPTCIDCGKELKYLGSLRCMSCAGKARLPRQKELITTCRACGKTNDKRGGFKGERGLCRKCAAPLSGQNRRRRVQVTCPNCGEIFEIKRYLSQINEKSFCKKECYNQWQVKNTVGNKGHNWRGGTVKYYGPNWRQQQRLCRKSANYKCQNCGKPQAENKTALDVHHIKPFKSFDYIPEQNDNYLLANDLSNLMALCRSCHLLLEPRKGEGYKIP